MRKAGFDRIVMSLLSLAVAGIFMPATAHADVNANFFLGQKMLDRRDWDPVEDQSEFGAEVTWGKKSWPIQIATDLLLSRDTTEDAATGIKVRGKTREFAFGVRKIRTSGVFRPYLGAGIAAVYGEFSGSLGGIAAKDDDTGFGIWIGGGVFWRLGPGFNIGLALRHSRATVDLFGEGGEGGGTHAGFLLGWGWPAGK